MAAADMATWRRQNSDAIAVELTLIDGTTLKGHVMVSRDKTLREMLSTPGEDFVDFDCKRDGPLVLAKTAIRLVRGTDAKMKDDKAKVEALKARQAELEKSDPYKFLGVTADIDSEGLHKAYIAMARMYHPDRFADANLPTEVVDYLNAMARRVNSVYDELTDERDGAR